MVNLPIIGPAKRLICKTLSYLDVGFGHFLRRRFIRFLCCAL
jgi:hypothetical protein